MRREHGGVGHGVLVDETVEAAQIRGSVEFVRQRSSGMSDHAVDRRDQPSRAADVSQEGRTKMLLAERETAGGGDVHDEVSVPSGIGA